MNGLANWSRLIRGLTICAVLAFVLTLSSSNGKFAHVSYKLSRSTIEQLLANYKYIAGALGTALSVTGLLFWGFTKWLWRYGIFRKLGMINFPDLSGTWHATSYPRVFAPFTSVTSIDHSFYSIRVTLIRNQSLGQSKSATLERISEQTIRLYVVYYSKFGERRSMVRIPAVDHGEDHSGTLSLDLSDDTISPAGWVLEGEYWTNKRKDQHDDDSKGTWGRIATGARRSGLVGACCRQNCITNRSCNIVLGKQLKKFRRECLF